MDKSNTGVPGTGFLLRILVYTVTLSFMAVQMYRCTGVLQSSDRHKLIKINILMLIHNPFHFHPGGRPINFASLCLQFVKISCLEFRVAREGFNKILYFSLVHNLQMPVTGLKRATFFSKKVHCTVGSLPSSFSCQKWL